jgi:hypothetical protein
VEPRAFEAVRRLVLASGADPSFNDLTDMSASIQAELAGSPLLGSDVDVDRTGDRTRLLVARCRVVHPGARRARIATELERVWQALRYRYLEAHALRSAANAVALSFVTQVEPNGRFLTGAIIAELPRER